MMEKFRQMVNDCIKIGLESNVSTRNKLIRLCYHKLERYNIYAVYKICAINHAVAILNNRKTSIRRGFTPRQPYAKRPLLKTYVGYKIINGILKVPLEDRQYYDIPPNNYMKGILSDTSLKVRSITLTASNTVSICICISKEVPEIECTSVEGVDRNLRNLTIGSHKRVIQYDLSKAVEVAENTRHIVASFKRNDIRIRKKITGKYGKRRRNRINQIQHHVSKAVVIEAKENKNAIAFEDITNIRKLYKRGNGQGRNYRSKLNGWSFAEIKRQIEYKAAWQGVKIIQLSIGETRGTSQHCPVCGKKISRKDSSKTRESCGVM